MQGETAEVEPDTVVPTQAMTRPLEEVAGSLAILLAQINQSLRIAA